MKSKKSAIVFALIFAVFIMAFLFIGIRIVFFLLSDAAWQLKALASLLLLTECFGAVHSFGYLMNIIRIIRGKNKRPKAPKLTEYPPIAILIPSYKEPLAILKDTLICCYNLTYPNLQIYLLDDSRYDRPWDKPEVVDAYKTSTEELCKYVGASLFRRKWRGAKAGIINDFLKFLDGQTLEDLEYFPICDNFEKPKYIIVFDADMNPFPDFAEPLIEMMEFDPKLSFIQTPQYYSNFEFNKVARAAGFQQIIFFEYICEAKGIGNTMFCCGTNVMIRRKALMSVGGFDESSVTEDIATSFKMHMLGWHSHYFNKISAFGMGPEDLGSYFKQQFRWALGTLSLGKSFLLNIFSYMKNAPSKGLIWEYFLSYTHYFVGWTYFIMLIFPLIFLFFNLPTYFMNTYVYLAVFFPYLALSIYVVIWTLLLRKHSLKGILTGMFLMLPVTFPVYMKAAVYALFNVKSSFVVTPKGQEEALPIRDLWPQLLAITLSACAIVWGFERLYFEREPVFGLIGNIIWCCYNISMLSFVFYFNNPDSIHDV